MQYDPGQEEVDDVNLDNERERHWSTVSEDNRGGLDDKKALLHTKRPYVYVNEN